MPSAEDHQDLLAVEQVGFSTYCSGGGTFTTWEWKSVSEGVRTCYRVWTESRCFGKESKEADFALD